MSDTTSDLAGARRCLAAYGADVTRWPEAARARWGAIAMSDALADAREEAGALDALLDASTPPKTPHDLANRIAANFHDMAASTPRRADAWRDGLFGWLRPATAGAFAGLAALGFASGAIVDRMAETPPHYEAYAYLLDGGLADFGAGDEGSLWEKD